MEPRLHNSFQQKRSFHVKLLGVDVTFLYKRKQIDRSVILGLRMVVSGKKPWSSFTSFQMHSFSQTSLATMPFWTAPKIQKWHAWCSWDSQNLRPKPVFFSWLLCVCVCVNFCWLFRMWHLMWDHYSLILWYSHFCVCYFVFGRALRESKLVSSKHVFLSRCRLWADIFWALVIW